MRRLIAPSEPLPFKLQEKIPTLDGWRGVSIIVVVLFHGRNGFFGEGSVLANLAARGQLGVDIFFAISGFLICRMLLAEQARRGDLDLRRFYTRRAFRIVPAYFVTLATFVVLGVAGVIPLRFLNVPSCVLFFRNFMPLGMDAGGDFYTSHFWTLAVEEQFYLLWPVLLLGLKAVRAARVAACAAMLALAWKVLIAYCPQFTGTIPMPMNLLTHTDTLLWGCVAAVYYPKLQEFVRRSRFSQWWLPVLLLFLATQATHRPLLRLLAALLLPALLLSTVLQPASWLSRVLGWRPLCWVGTLSYSIYLWQELFLPELVTVAARGPLRHLQLAPWNVVAILACAIASRYLVEIPSIRIGRRLSAVPMPVVQVARLRVSVTEAASVPNIPAALPGPLS